MSNDKGDYLTDGLRVAVHHKQMLDQLGSEHDQQRHSLDAAINSSEALLRRLGKALPVKDSSTSNSLHVITPVRTKSWEEILAEAKQAIPGEVDFNDVLTPAEIDAVLAKHQKLGEHLGWLGSLDRYDVALAVSAGILSGLTDIFLVQVPAHPGFLGSPASEGGWLSNKVKELFGEVLPPEKIKELEGLYKVSFDPSTSSDLKETVAGLGPHTHRYQSLGHDPILGFIFGVKDVLCGEFTAIDKFGNVIVQQTAAPLLEGEHFIIRLLEAIRKVGGHLASDVATPAGLPAPLMPLLSFFQFGTIGKQGYTIAEVARQMYRSGYDLRHFIAASVPLAISELIVRLGFMVRKLNAGATLAEAFPNAAHPQLRRQLLIAHGVAGVINAGKVTVTSNPLSISWPLVLTLLRYGMPEMMYLIYGQEKERAKLVETEIMADYRAIHQELDTQLMMLPHIVI
ncbi:hypothetical protein [Aeromonas sp. FDAARGOS 1408]|uniref:hypothetical protein n=1 Tax=Aeromonas TaxID=642 RepID=UPI001C226AC0|nr:hypothetical protein [Aeromonas sp. FDAARGOS 1408]QXC10024.1 hypothetical protein I6L38_08805 [Aeromonas sp. FDAARGOS 1408]HDX8347173.1 hypothetical protein [Aeromonas dhakensis]